MEAKVEVVENDVNKQLFSKEFKGEASVKGSDYAINQMLYILGGYALAPTPLPSDLISLWADPEVDKSQPCEYCSYERSKIAFPNVKVDLKRRVIKFISLKRACGRCYNIISIKRLLSKIVEAFRNKKDQFNTIYKHFLKVNGLNESEKSESDKSTSDVEGDKNLIFQDLVSMAYSLNQVMSRIGFILKRVKLVDYGHFKGTEFTLDKRGGSSDVGLDESDDSRSVDALRGSRIYFDVGGGVNRIVSNLSMNFTRRVPSIMKEVIERSIEGNVERISLKDMLDLIVSLRMCNSLSERVASKCIERINKEIKNTEKSKNDDTYIKILDIALELAEHEIVDVGSHQKKRKDGTIKGNMVGENSIDDNVIADSKCNPDGGKKENGKVEKASMINVTKFVCDNMKVIGGTSESKLFRLIRMFHAILMEGRLKEGDEMRLAFDGLYGRYLRELTSLVLESSIFSSLMGGPVDNGNVASQSVIKSLNDCNRVIDILKLNAMNSRYQKCLRGHVIDESSDHVSGRVTRYVDSANIRNKNNAKDDKKDLMPMAQLRKCVIGDMYSVIVENISKFTSGNIVDLIKTVRILGEPYPKELVNGVVNVYVKHIAQYSINNMIALLEELKLMNLRSEKAMLNTVVSLPRKASTIDSFEHIIRLMQAYEGYESEYLNMFVQQQIQQIYYKINPKYFQKVTYPVSKVDELCTDRR
nr:hypothetical protein MACL_00002469 [Theileria orientalis]